MTPEAFDRIFTGADQVTYPPPVRSFRQSDVERALTGDGLVGGQPDSVHSYGRMTLDSAEPIEIRYRDGMVEFRELFDQPVVVPVADIVTFPAIIEGYQVVSLTQPQWKYRWAEARYNSATGWWYASGPRTSQVYVGGILNAYGHPAYNLRERPLIASGDDYMWQPYFQPISAGNCVEMFQYTLGGSIVTWFSEVNNAANLPFIGLPALGIITAVFGGPNATYDIAWSQADPFISPTPQNFTMTNVVPADRRISAADVDYIAKGVGDNVLVLNGLNNGVWFMERIGDSIC